MNMIPSFLIAASAIIASACQPVKQTVYEANRSRTRGPVDSSRSGADLVAEKFPPYKRIGDGSSLSSLVDEFTLDEEHGLEIAAHRDMSLTEWVEWTIYAAAKASPASGGSISIIVGVMAGSMAEEVTDDVVYRLRGFIPSKIEVKVGGKHGGAVAMAASSISKELSPEDRLSSRAIAFDAADLLKVLNDLAIYGADIRVSSNQRSEVYRVGPEPWAKLIEAIMSTPLTSEAFGPSLEKK